MQFIGIKDKFGTEIYEGDIVKHRNGIQQVTYEEELYAFSLCISGCVNDQEGGCIEAESVEVIGNVYENPELLERDKIC